MITLLLIISVDSFLLTKLDFTLVFVCFFIVGDWIAFQVMEDYQRQMEKIEK